MDEILEALRSGQVGIIRAVPPELLVRIVEDHLEAPDILRLCQSSKEFNQMFCRDPLFWRHLYQRDYGIDPMIYDLGPENYRALYFARTMGRLSPRLQALISIRLGINQGPNALRQVDPDVFIERFSRYCQRVRQPLVIPGEIFNREQGLIKFLRELSDFRILEYRGNYYFPPSAIGFPGSYPFIGLREPAPTGIWPMPCGYARQQKAEEATARYSNQFGIIARYV